jgi:pyrroline-5-carboxylate reductase
MKIAFIGGGNMGATYARAFIRSGIVKKTDLLIVEKNKDKQDSLKKEEIGELHGEIDSKLSAYDIIFLAVKPQDFKSTLSGLKPVLKKEQLIISIMAGITIDSLIELLGHQNIVRAMPNTPAQLGFGITGFTAHSSVSQHTISQVDTLLETTGKSIFMEEENLLDAVTAISGSGPAYFFYFVKNMTEAGIAMGLEPHVASMLVKQTMLGSFHMLINTAAAPDELIRSVASKGGTTEAALKHFEKSEIGNNIITALKAAETRAKELSKEVLN